MGFIISHEIELTRGARKVIVRTAVPRDAEALLLHVRGILEEGRFSVTQPDEFRLTEEQEREWIRDHGNDPAKIAIVAECDGAIVGMIHFEVGARGRLAHRGVFALSVSQGWRGAGIGRALIETLLRWAQEHPTVEKVSLAVLADNEPALQLYRKLGFVEEGRRVREIKLGPGQYVDDILMYRWVK